MPSCKGIYYSNPIGNTPGKTLYFLFPNPKTERKNTSTGYNINKVLER